MKTINQELKKYYCLVCAGAIYGKNEQFNPIESKYKAKLWKTKQGAENFLNKKYKNCHAQMFGQVIPYYLSESYSFLCKKLK